MPLPDLDVRPLSGVIGAEVRGARSPTRSTTGSHPSRTRSCARTRRTGERALFVNPGFTSHIDGLDRAESDLLLLRFLYMHDSVKPEYVVRDHWAAGDLAFWDNRATQHAVVGDFGSQHRVVQRVTLRGDHPTRRDSDDDPPRSAAPPTNCAPI